MRLPATTILGEKKEEEVAASPGQVTHEKEEYFSLENRAQRLVRSRTPPRHALSFSSLDFVILYPAMRIARAR